MRAWMEGAVSHRDKLESGPDDGWEEEDGGFSAGPLTASLPVERYLAAIIAHELSNPFTALAGRVDLMRNRKDVTATAAVTRDLDAMRNANERIERILTNIKAFSRREGPPPRPVELMTVVRNAVSLFRATPLGSQVEVNIVEWSQPIRVLASPSLFCRSVAATIEAVVGRSPEIKSIDISLSTNEVDEEVSLLFCDQGPELTEEQMARVFHPFSGQTLPEWTGAVTLAYSYYIIRAWGGTYRFHSKGRDTITEMCLALQPA